VTSTPDQKVDRRNLARLWGVIDDASAKSLISSDFTLSVLKSEGARIDGDGAEGRVVN
jgi:hypothetical protein